MRWRRQRKFAAMLITSAFGAAVAVVAWHNRSGDVRTFRVITQSNVGWLTVTPRYVEIGERTNDGVLMVPTVARCEFDSVDDHGIDPRWFEIMAINSTRHQKWMGFGWFYDQYDRTHDVYAPTWCVIAGSMTPFSLSLIRYLLLKKIKEGGLCPRCNYDLRATPDRCPECGFASLPGRWTEAHLR